MTDEKTMIIPGELKIDTSIDTSTMVETLKKEVKQFMQSDRYKEFLDFNSRIYDYSLNNKQLLFLQKPDLTLVGSFTFWKQQNRFVKKGEHGLKVLAPITKKRTLIVECFDEHKKAILNADGSHKTKEVVQQYIGGFKYATVFDISQTDGEPIPSILHELSGSSKISKTLIASIHNISTIPILSDTQNLLGNSNGCYMPKKNLILYKTGLADDHLVKTLLHEITHSRLHSMISDYTKNRSFYEVEAESAAYMVAKHFGLDTSDYSIGYMAAWSTGQNIDHFQTSLERSANISKEIIKDLESDLKLRYNEKINERKNEIISDLIANSHIPTKNLVEKIYQLNQITGVKNLNEILKLSKGSKNTKVNELLTDIEKELNKKCSQHVPKLEPTP